MPFAQITHLLARFMIAQVCADAIFVRCVDGAAACTALRRPASASRRNTVRLANCPIRAHLEANRLKIIRFYDHNARPLSG